MEGQWNERRWNGKEGMDGTYVVKSNDKTTLDIFLGGGKCTI